MWMIPVQDTRMYSSMHDGDIGASVLLPPTAAGTIKNSGLVVKTKSSTRQRDTFTLNAVVTTHSPPNLALLEEDRVTMANTLGLQVAIEWYGGDTEDVE